MKYSWRITKYNPKNRNNKGGYSKEEWTSISDIGNNYLEKELTIQGYLNVENLYVDAIKCIMNSLGIPYLKVRQLSKGINELEINKYCECYSKEMVDLYKKINDEDIVDLIELSNLIRLVLREDLWCKFEFESKMFVHFGYDYYMYIGTSEAVDNALIKIMDSGLFVESWESPYLDEW